jgi:thiol-disulfide isomerase/thioredoxin
MALAHGAPPPAQPATSPGPLEAGQPAPTLRLTDLDGRVIDLADFRGSDTLVLFWNPGCGFCQQMLGDLRAWEASPPPGAPKLLVVSTGGVEENRALGLRAPVVLDQSFTLGSGAGYRVGAIACPHGTGGATWAEFE